MPTPEQRGGGRESDLPARQRPSPAPDELGRLGRFLLESAEGYALISFDLDGRIMSWSTWAERAFGWTAEEAVGRPGSMLFTPEDIEQGAMKDEMRTVRKRGHARDEAWHMRKDGRRFWGSGVMTGLRDDQDRLVGYAKIVRDLTGEKKAKERLQASEQRLRIALEAGNMGAWDWDIGSGHITWSDMLERIHGLEPGAFPGTFEAFVATIHPDDRAGVLEAIDRTVRERRDRYDVSYRTVNPDGSVRRLATRGRLLLDDRGEPVRMVGVCVDETERRETELLRGRLAALVESSEDAIIGIDLEGIIRSWNRGAEHNYGYGADEVVGRSISMLIPPDRSDELAGNLTRLREGERVEQYDTQRVTRNGDRLDVSVSISPVRDETGRIVAAATIGRDITARKRAESRERFLAEAGRILASSLDYDIALRRLLALAVPRIADACAVYTPEKGTLQTVALQHSDRRKLDIMSELDRRYPPDPDASVGAYHVLRTRKPELVTEVTPERLGALARDDEHRRLLQELGVRSVIYMPLVARGKPLGVLSLSLTEGGRRYVEADLALAESFAERAALAIDNAGSYGAAERRAREEEALRRAAEAVAAQYTIDEVLQEIAASALAATDADGAFVEQLDSATDQVEVVAAEGIETPPRGTRIAYAGSFAARVMEGGRAELVARLADATDALSSALAAFPDAGALVVPLLDSADGGSATGALFLLRRSGTPPFRDRDLERTETFGRLASLAIGKVRLLEQSQRQRQELERVMESRARLVRGFSHDVKNPLGAADGHLELLEDGVLEPLQPRQVESVHRARASVRSALELIDEVVDLARMQAGRLEIEPSPVDASVLARDIAGEYRAEAESIGLDMVLDLTEEGPQIQSDPTRLRQILGNMLSNAVRYTPEGGRITLRTRRLDAAGEDEAPGPGEWLAVDVSDTGSGIPREQQEAIFDEFTRVDPGRDRGAGLGLAISRRLARLLGGDLTVESEEGKGSTFTLWLPPSAPSAEPAQPGIAEPERGEPHGGPERREPEQVEPERERGRKALG